MRITRDKVGGFWTIAALDSGEDAILRPLVAALQKPGTSFLYGGRKDQPDGFVQVVVNAGGTAVRKTETEGNGTCTFDAIDGGLTVTLAGTSEDDKHDLFALRDCMFWGSMPLMFMDGSLEGPLVSFRIPGKKCKLCGTLMVCRGRCEWNTCEACVTKCQHEYEHGIISGGGTDIGMGEFCKHCGVGKPRAEGEREPSQIEHHLAVQRETGIAICYKDGPPNTPREVVLVERAARRYRHSKAGGSKRK